MKTEELGLNWKSFQANWTLSLEAGWLSRAPVNPDAGRDEGENPSIFMVEGFFARDNTEFDYASGSSY